MTVLVPRLLTPLATGVLRALKWFVHEFLLLTLRPAAGSRLANLCRVIGCFVIVASLRTELRYGLLPNITAAVIQLVAAGLTAILFGNAAKELAFDLTGRFAIWWGRAFVRSGLTIGGKTFWEVQFGDGTWIRCEREPMQAVYEWTEPDGRCNRLEVRSPDLEKNPPYLLENKPIVCRERSRTKGNSAR